MRACWLLLLLSCVAPLVGQTVYNVRETLHLPAGVSASGAVIYGKLPLAADGQSVTNVRFSTPPDPSPDPAAPNTLRWSLDRVTDSLRMAYRVALSPRPAWDPDSVSHHRAPIAWPPVGEGGVDRVYALPPLIREDVAKTEFGSIEPEDTTVADVDRLIRRLNRRIKTVRDPASFDYGRPLLEDVYRRNTTARRKHLLLSLALQILELPHRVVAGKVLSYDEVRENELWVEIPVAGRWYRVYYGDGIDRGDWLPPNEPDRFLACSYDWRDYTLEVVSAPGAPYVPTTLDATYTNVVLDFWTAKDAALGRKQYARAISLLDSVLTYLPRSVATISEIGLVYTEAGRPADGLPFLERALQLAITPDDRGMVMVQLAKYYSLLEDAEASLRALAKAYRLSTIDLSVIFADPRFRYLARQDRLEQRLSAYLRAEE
ncbi:lipopolysaccharide assembly protein LapB [Lewinella sp. JB7]|uniref:tetratricopeptide repeat protein n=1 Tax=Lewinella sp. JB7 TaxID=2962887 RepID=UPI0020C9587C|nr:tetratricopeptide repeat protein [Lewinella sp. JB7]MCP9237691.1 hypothetical protein [Lewinella sp. JB7]